MQTYTIYTTSTTTLYIVINHALMIHFLLKHTPHITPWFFFSFQPNHQVKKRLKFMNFAIGLPQPVLRTVTLFYLSKHWFKGSISCSQLMLK